MERVCVFIDGSSFYFGLIRNNRLTCPDYIELSQVLAGPDRQLVKAFYYNAAYDPALSPEQKKTQDPFLDSLSSTPELEVRLGRITSTHEGGFKEKNVQSRLAADLLYYAAKNLYDTAVVVTEDSDFSHAMIQAKDLKRQVELCLFKDHQPRELIQAADKTIPMEKLLEKYSAKIFPEAVEDNIGNRMEEPPVGKRTKKPGH